MRKSIAKLTLITLALISCNISAENHQQASIGVPAKAFIISPKDGEVVPKNFKVRFGLKGMTVSPAGVEKANSGHHHLLVNGKQLPDLTKPLGSEVQHFGSGQTETTLTLSPGNHTLQLILADYKHLPHNPAVISEKITVTVK
jgi:hypothetical protein